MMCHETGRLMISICFRPRYLAIFPGKGPASTVIRWIPRTDWKGVSSDPSGRVSSTVIRTVKQ